MVVTLKVLTDIYSKPDKHGNVRIIKRNVEYLKQFESSEIKAEHYINSKGTISKKWSVVKQGEEYFRVNHRFEDIEKLNKRLVVNGFKS